MYVKYSLTSMDDMIGYGKIIIDRTFKFAIYDLAFTKNHV